jgi:chromosome segregation ATPase
MKRRLCREYIEEIERLERSLRELEEEIIELKMQLQLKVDETNRLAIENASLRHKVEMLKRREKLLFELFRKFGVPVVYVDGESFEDKPPEDSERKP